MKKFKLTAFLLGVMVVLSMLVMVACDRNEGDGTPEVCTVTFAGVKTTTSQVVKGDKAVKPEAEQKKSGYVFLGWYLGDKLYDWDAPVTEDITIEARFEKSDITIPHGVAYSKDGKYISGAENTLVVLSEETFSAGSFTATVKPNTANDCGVVFGIDDEASDNWWEEEHYFCAIINKDGVFIFAEVIPGANPWNEITTSEALKSTYSPENTYTFEVQYVKTEYAGYCRILLNNTEVAALEINQLPGSGVGYRAQKEGVEFSGMTFHPENVPVITEEEPVGDFYVRHGQFHAEGSALVTDTTEVIGVYKDPAPTDAVITATLEKGAYDCDDGIIFCLSDNNRTRFWENPGISYYFFFISRDNTAYLGKVTGDSEEPWQELAVSTILPYETAYELKVELTGNHIKCYVDGESVLEYTDAEMLTGTGVGIRAGSESAIYSDFSVTETTAI